MCQFCGARNPDDRNYCYRCQNRLIVVSGILDPEDLEAFDATPEEQFSFDEHLLERISLLEDSVRRVYELVRQALETLRKLEQKSLINQTGIDTLRDLLEAKKVLRSEEWSELWESRIEYQLLAFEKRERFLAIKDRTAALYGGKERAAFRGLLDEAELALLGFDLERALGSLEEAHRLDPENYELSFFLGETCFNEGEGQRALAFFERVLAVRPTHFESLIFAGVLYHERGDDTRAERLLRSAVALDPEAFLPAFCLGAVFASRGRLEEAVALLERAVAAEPLPQASYLLGSCRFEMGRLSSSISALSNAVELDPDFEDAWRLLALVYLQRGWHKKSLTALDRAERLMPRRLPHRALARLIDTESTRGAAASWRARAERALASGRPRASLSYFRRALVHAPDDPSLLAAYTMVCLELDRLREIEASVDKVLALDPSPTLRAVAYAMLMEALRLEGKVTDSNQVGEQLLARDGESAIAVTLARVEMAFNLAERGDEVDLEEALHAARIALESAPPELSAPAAGALGWVQYRRGELDAAVESLKQSSAGEDATVENLTRLAMAQLERGDRDDAQATLARARDLAGQIAPLEARILEHLHDSSRLLDDLENLTEP
ncbi:MAG: tetratricopeptide repeat protein [Acidobacteriota bacterium]